MPRHRQIQTKFAKAEERKRRQEKFRKITKSLLDKVRGLARDTDTWVAIIVRDRNGGIQSVRSSENFYWLPSIKDLMRKHPSGPHEFLEKPAFSGSWKELIEAESESFSTDEDLESVEASAGLTGTTAPLEAAIGASSTIVVDQRRVIKEAEADRDATNDDTMMSLKPSMRLSKLLNMS